MHVGVNATAYCWSKEGEIQASIGNVSLLRVFELLDLDGFKIAESRSVNVKGHTTS